MAFVISHWERDSPLAPPPPPFPHHISLYPTFPLSLSLLLSGFKGLKCFSCLLCIKCPRLFGPPPTNPLNFAVLREKWLSGGEAADAVKPSQTEAGIITGRCPHLIPCERVNRAGVAEKVIPAITKQLILYIVLFGAKICYCSVFFSVLSTFLSPFMVATLLLYPTNDSFLFFNGKFRCHIMAIIHNNILFNTCIFKIHECFFMLGFGSICGN